MNPNEERAMDVRLALQEIESYAETNADGADRPHRLGPYRLTVEVVAYADSHAGAVRAVENRLTDPTLQDPSGQEDDDG